MIGAVTRAFVVGLSPTSGQALSDSTRPRVRALAWFAIAAQAVFVLGWVVGGLLERGYSPTRDYISELGRHGASHPWIFQASIVIWGAGFIALALAIVPALRGRPWSRVAPTLFALAGLLAIMLAPFRLSCEDTVSHACRALEEAGKLPWHEYAHVWGSVALEAALWLTAFALARSFWPGRLARLLLLGGIAMGTLIAVVYATEVDRGGSAGLVQRLELLVAYGWVIAWAGALLTGAIAGRSPGNAIPVSVDGAAG